MNRKEIYKKMREAKERKRLETDVPEYPIELPNLRRKIVITDFDFEKEEHVFEFYKTNRIDCYKVYVDGKLWKSKIGWSNILKGIRKFLPRLTMDI